MWTVKVEKDQREEQSEELEARVTEGCTQEFQSGDCRQENVTAGGQHKQEFRRQIQRALHQSDCVLCCVFVAVGVHSLNSQLFAVTKGKAIVSECTQHDGRVHQVLLKAQEPHVESLKPHQHSVLWNTSEKINDEASSCDLST